MDHPGISPNRMYKDEFFLPSQKPIPVDYKNASLKKFFNVGGSSSDRNRYTSILCHIC